MAVLFNIKWRSHHTSARRFKVLDATVVTFSTLKAHAQNGDKLSKSMLDDWKESMAEQTKTGKVNVFDGPMLIALATVSSDRSRMESDLGQTFRVGGFCFILGNDCKAEETILSIRGYINEGKSAEEVITLMESRKVPGLSDHLITPF